MLFGAAIKGERNQERRDNQAKLLGLGFNYAGLPQNFKTRKECDKWINDNKLNDLVYSSEWDWL